MDTSGPEHAMPANTLKEFADYIRIHPLTPKSKMKYPMEFLQTESGTTLLMIAWRDLTKRIYWFLERNYFELKKRCYGM